jgi:hypothetical protein
MLTVNSIYIVRQISSFLKNLAYIHPGDRIGGKLKKRHKTYIYTYMHSTSSSRKQEPKLLLSDNVIKRPMTRGPELTNWTLIRM